MAAISPKTPATMVALESFYGRVDKVDVVFRKGDVVSSDDKAVAKWPKLFGPYQQVEQATAAPGEKRGA